MNVKNPVVKKLEGMMAKTANLSQWLESKKARILPVIPRGTVNIDRFMQAAKLAIYNPKTPLLAQCTPESILKSLIEAASLGFEVGGVLGQAYLIPYNESYKTSSGYVKKMTCHFQMGYQGLTQLARRSGTIKTIACETVYANDVFSVEFATGRKIHHALPQDFSMDRGEPVAYYCIVELTNGGEQFCVMSKKEMIKFRDQYSRAYKAGDMSNPWNSAFDAMARKTVCIRALKLCPISVESLELIRQKEIDEAVQDSRQGTLQTVGMANNIGTEDMEDISSMAEVEIPQEGITQDKEASVQNLASKASEEDSIQENIQIDIQEEQQKLEREYSEAVKEELAQQAEADLARQYEAESNKRRGVTSTNNANNNAKKPGILLAEAEANSSQAVQSKQSAVDAIFGE